MINNKLKNIFDGKKVFVYKVQKGESVSILAKRYHTTKEILISINGLSCEISDGEYIVVERVEGEEYTVEPLDSIESIAERFSTTSWEIMTKNKIFIAAMIVTKNIIKQTYL
jgi:LysM repeat protein